MHRDHLGQRARICQLEVACSYRLRLRRLDRGVQFSHLKSIAKREKRGEREIRKWQKRSRRQRRTTTPAVSGLAPGPVAYVSYSFNFAVSFPSALCCSTSPLLVQLSLRDVRNQLLARLPFYASDSTSRKSSLATLPSIQPPNHHAYSQPHRIRHQRIQGRGLAQVGLR